MANKRRANGEGSWWQLPDRTWVHQITIGRKENGSPERKSFKGKTKAICKQRKEEWLAERRKDYLVTAERLEELPWMQFLLQQTSTRFSPNARQTGRISRSISDAYPCLRSEGRTL